METILQISPITQIKQVRDEQDYRDFGDDDIVWLPACPGITMEAGMTIKKKDGKKSG